MQLPIEVRESLVVLLDEYFENDNDAPDASELAELIVRNIESICEEAGVEEAEDIVSIIEEEAELEDSLAESLAEEFSSNEDLELTGEEVIRVFARVCAISWDQDEEIEELDELDDFEESESPFDDEF
jgi:hypothetical protein